MSVPIAVLIFYGKGGECHSGAAFDVQAPLYTGVFARLFLTPAGYLPKHTVSKESAPKRKRSYDELDGLFYFRSIALRESRDDGCLEEKIHCKGARNAKDATESLNISAETCRCGEVIFYGLSFRPQGEIFHDRSAIGKGDFSLRSK